MKSERDRTMALGGIFQAAALAAQVARGGLVDALALEASVESLFQRSAASVADVYGGPAGVAGGLEVLLGQLAAHPGGTRNIEVSRYVIALLHLERKLIKRPAMLEQIADGIDSAAQRREHFPLLHPNILAQLADIYVNTISTLQPRIMIQGEPLHLQNPDNVHKIRTLLLAGIRSAMLWRQCGGNRLQILIGRKRLIANGEKLLGEIRAAATPGGA
ncbi:MAG: high frequency lysogenization protein HflD [gamma proteobacterium symbiont of Phacoides pectinatus]